MEDERKITACYGRGTGIGPEVWVKFGAFSGVEICVPMKIEWRQKMMTNWARIGDLSNEPENDIGSDKPEQEDGSPGNLSET